LSNRCRHRIALAALTPNCAAAARHDSQGLVAALVDGVMAMIAAIVLLIYSGPGLGRHDLDGASGPS
jgi:hypothetical protein